VGHDTSEPVYMGVKQIVHCSVVLDIYACGRMRCILGTIFMFCKAGGT